MPYDQSIDPCDLSTKSYLPGVSTYFPFTVTNFKVVVCHFVQAKVTGISGLSFSTIYSTFLRKNYPSTFSAGLWSRSWESKESHVFSWSRESESVFKTAGVGVGFLELLESESGVGVGFSKLHESES